MLSREDLYIAKIFILCREIQLFFCLYFVISHNEIDSDWLRQWNETNKIKSENQKYCFVSLSILSNGFFSADWTTKKNENQFYSFLIGKSFFYKFLSDNEWTKQKSGFNYLKLLMFRFFILLSFVFVANWIKTSSKL